MKGRRMQEVIKNLRQITRRYKTCYENNLDFELSDRDIFYIKRATYFLALIDSLVKKHNKEKKK